MVGGSGGMLPQENFENYNPWNTFSSIWEWYIFYRIPKAVKYVEDMIFSWIILNGKRMWKFKQKEGHKLLWKFGAVFSPYNNCLQVSRAKSDFKPKPWCTIWLYYISKLYWIISNDSSYWNKNFLVLPPFKTKASVKIIGGSCTLLCTSPPPSVCHCSITNQNLKLENFWKLIVISIKSWLHVYIYFHVYHHPGILVIFFPSLFSSFLYTLFLVYRYICWLHSILELYVTNYGINKIYYACKQPCKCANYFVITVSNIYVC